jgi:hypothetical protein
MTTRIRTLALALVAALSAVPGAGQAGTGWSRAGDLSAYSAMRLFGGIAREQAVLCAHFAPAAVAHDWDVHYGGREAALMAALAARHGEAAVRLAASPRSLREPCRPLPDGYWRIRYERMLRLLEARMDPAWPGIAPRGLGKTD